MGYEIEDLCYVIYDGLCDRISMLCDIWWAMWSKIHVMWYMMGYEIEDLCHVIYDGLCDRSMLCDIWWAMW